MGPFVRLGILALFAIASSIAPARAEGLRCELRRKTGDDPRNVERLLVIVDSDTNAVYASTNFTEKLEMARLDEASLLAYRDDLGGVCRAFVEATACQRLNPPSPDDRGRLRHYRSSTTRRKFENLADCRRSRAAEIRNILENFAYESRYLR